MTDRDAGSAGEPADLIRRQAVLLAALAQDGLTFAANDYEVDRYAKVAEVAVELMGILSGAPAAELALELGRDSGYATPKVDVRGALIDEQERFLLMREKSDGRWSLPGGWADPLDTPAQAVEREVLEESGYGARAVKLVACYDRDTRGHRPPLSVSVYKLFFLCVPTGAVRPPDELETLEIGWFALSELPTLSAGRLNRHELERLLAHHREPSLPTEWD